MFETMAQAVRSVMRIIAMATDFSRPTAEVLCRC